MDASEAGRTNDLPCTIEDVISLLDITVVRDYGTRLICRCPFCSDRSGHFDVDPTENIFHCYRCGAGGGVLHLYAACQNVSLRTAGEDLRRIFRSDESREIIKQRPKREEHVSTEMEIASVKDRNRTYRNLLSLLSLAPAHREALTRRGMTEEDIEWCGCRTTPAVRMNRLVRQLRERGCVLSGVPGFFCDRETGDWKLDIRGHGIMLPDCNADGEIEAIQIRLDEAWKGHKFHNLTSSGRYYGTSAACCPNFAWKPEGDTVLVTEGVLKSNLAHRFSGRLGKPLNAVGLTGVGMKSQYRRALGTLKQHGVKKILLAYDMDFRTNDAVANARSFALKTGAEHGFEMIPLEWSSECKGIDDLLCSFLRQRT